MLRDLVDDALDWLAVHLYRGGAPVMRRRTRRELHALGLSLLADGSIPNYLDIGAAGGLRPEWEEAARLGYAVPWCADFAEQAPDHLPYVFGSENRSRDFYVTALPGCSSCLEPERSDWLLACPLARYFDTVDVIRVDEVRADTVVDRGEMPVPDFLKLDVQGYELECLRGFGRHLDRILAVELETHWKTLYKHQPLFPEVRRFLEGEGFVLRHMEPDSDWGDGEIVELDAYFTRRKSDLADHPRKVRLIEFWEALLRIPLPAPHVPVDLDRAMEEGIREGYLPGRSSPGGRSEP